MGLILRYFDLNFAHCLEDTILRSRRAHHAGFPVHQKHILRLDLFLVSHINISQPSPWNGILVVLWLCANLDKHQQTGVLYKYDGGEEEEKKGTLGAPSRIDVDYTGCWYMELGSICKTILTRGVEGLTSSYNTQRCHVRSCVWAEARLAALIDEVAHNVSRSRLCWYCVLERIYTGHGPFQRQMASRSRLMKSVRWSMILGQLFLRIDGEHG